MDRPFMKTKKYFVTLFLLHHFAQAQPFLLPPSMPDENSMIQVLSQTSGLNSFNQRTYEISEYFQETPYLLGPAGEGDQGDFDQKPLMIFDHFDCVTFIETVLSLARIEVLPNEKIQEIVKSNLINIKYNNQKISYQTRNHFTELDWINHQIRTKFLKEIVQEINSSPKIQKKIIHRQAWFFNKNLNDLFLPGLSPNELAQKLIEFQNLGHNFPIMEQAELNYLSWDQLMDPQIQHKIPLISVFSLVRGDDLENPKPVMVSHQGFLINKPNGELVVRHASSGKNMKVVDELLSDFIDRQKKLIKWPSLGFHLLSYDENTKH